jgi:hypothetical protein
MGREIVYERSREQVQADIDRLNPALRKPWRRCTHPNTDLFVEFPAGPLEFGSRVVQHDEIPRLDTPWGPLCYWLPQRVELALCWRRHSPELEPLLVPDADPVQYQGQSGPTTRINA